MLLPILECKFGSNLTPFSTRAFSRDLDENKASASEGKKSAFSIFQNKDKMGQASSVKTLNTKHKNCITNIQKGPDGKLSTSSLDGQVALWKV
tara:strand:+ start:226 stop:504 length:279 start_codon:yes stop_codon:yes gene_type:complete